MSSLSRDRLIVFPIWPTRDLVGRRLVAVWTRRPAAAVRAGASLLRPSRPMSRHPYHLLPFLPPSLRLALRSALRALSFYTAPSRSATARPLPSATRPCLNTSASQQGAPACAKSLRPGANLSHGHATRSTRLGKMARVRERLCAQLAGPATMVAEAAAAAVPWTLCARATLSAGFTAAGAEESAVTIDAASSFAKILARVMGRRPRLIL